MKQSGTLASLSQTRHVWNKEINKNRFGGRFVAEPDLYAAAAAAAVAAAEQGVQLVRLSAVTCRTLCFPLPAAMLDVSCVGGA